MACAKALIEVRCLTREVQNIQGRVRGARIGGSTVSSIGLAGSSLCVVLAPFTGFATLAALGPYAAVSLGGSLIN